MTRSLAFGLAAAAALTAVASCGDNARECGDGTMELRGVCVPAATTMCGDGTKLDNGECVIDPAACQAGTVLVADQCVDPTQNLVIDLEEGPEPNGIAIATGVEPSALPAGTITLKPIGETFVVRGHLTPFEDADGDHQPDPDFDTYVITVTAPTLLAVSVDGVGGVQGGFYAVGAANGPVPGFQRYGLNLTGDTAHRRLFLPVAGQYLLAIADTRSLDIGKNPPRPAGSGGAAGGADAVYYASITAEAIPAPSLITVTGGTGTQPGMLATDDVKFFTAVMGGGSNLVREVIPGAAAASLAVVDVGAGVLEGYADENPGALPPTKAEVTVAGIQPGATPLIAVDAVYNYGPAPEPFTLTITVP